LPNGRLGGGPATEVLGVKMLNELNLKNAPELPQGHITLFAVEGFPDFLPHP
jgi:hypothetical protein